jgi:hypothetical protein
LTICKFGNLKDRQNYCSTTWFSTICRSTTLHSVTRNSTSHRSASYSRHTQRAHLILGEELSADFALKAALPVGPRAMRHDVALVLDLAAEDVVALAAVVRLGPPLLGVDFTNQFW